ncbi:hypothetical protein [Neobacillus terrae]|uniref:hypothetical protein n=1 Tax=Neobacillus terrae TaxID=3034837 RepID=UPI001A9C518E
MIRLMPVGGPQDVGQEGVATGRGDFSLSSSNQGAWAFCSFMEISYHSYSRMLFKSFPGYPMYTKSFLNKGKFNDVNQINTWAAYFRIQILD